MALIDRVKNILTDPRAEWVKIADEPATVSSLYTGYILILAAIGPVALALRFGMLGFGMALVTYLIGLAITYVLALIVDALAPNFGGEKGLVQSLKLVAYSYTAAWLAGIFRLIPWIGGLLALLGVIYSFYTFYLGAPVLRKASADKAAGFTIIVVICGLVLGFVLSGVLLSMLFGSAMLAGAGLMR
ncbi:MAG: YIP1 family protein [Pseudomonadota bacterium]|nr:YIP1 family protein [Pseudomonadota bacterium]